ncbi:hypothetical protein FACS1894170_12080 [Planctomycetales bacterium]|nr:hypothetical protein FACS1894170_12080 [Planctomycetales bacterium]
MKISIHAKQRLFERYQIILSRREEKNFCRLLQNGKTVVTLSDGRKACFFRDTWLLFHIENGTVKTFCSPTAVTEREILNSRDILQDEPVATPPVKHKPVLRDVPTTDLPPDFSEAETILHKSCGALE